MSMQFLIDGYNVIHHSSLLKPLAMHDFEAARDELVTKVSRYCSISDDRARIVFDGRGRRLKSRVTDDLSTNLTVSFSPHHLTADSVIERSVYQAANRREITVVTADRGIRSLCMGLGSPTMMPDIFLETVRDALGTLSGQLETRSTSQATSFLEERLDPETLEHLRVLRERLKGKG
jgi:predicted RNA-binding protein with PIN domain